MAKKKASSDWRAQRLAAYQSLAVMAGNVGSTIPTPVVPKYTAQPSSSKSGSALEFWNNKNNTGLGSISPNGKSEQENQNKRSTVAKILDALSVGAYATATGADRAIKSSYKTGGDIPDLVSEGLKGIGEGAASAFKDGKKTTFSDVIDTLTTNSDRLGQSDYDQDSKAYKATSAGLGFAGDVLLDPLTYIPVAGIASVAGKVAKGTKAGKATGEFLNNSSSYTKFRDGINAIPETTAPSKAKAGRKGRKGKPTPVKWDDNGQAVNETGQTIYKNAEALRKAVGRGEVTPNVSGGVTPPSSTEGFRFDGSVPKGFGTEVPDSQPFPVTGPREGRVPRKAKKDMKSQGLDPKRQELDFLKEIQDNLPPKLRKDAQDITGASVSDLAKAAPTEQAAKELKDADDITEEIINLAKVKHDAKFTNPALDTKMKFSDWTTKAKSGDYSVEQLQPFMDYHKVSSVDDLIDAMKGKNYKATINNIRKGMKDSARKQVEDSLPGSSASVSERMAEAQLSAEKIVEGSLDNVKPELVEFADSTVAKTADDLSRQVLNINVRYPSQSGKPAKASHSTVHYRTGSKKSVTFLGSNNIMDQSTAGTKILGGMINHFAKGNKSNGIKGITDDQIDLSIAALKRHEQTTSAMGMFPHLGDAVKGMPLGLSDALASMPKSFVRKYMVGNAVNQLRYKTFLSTVGDALKADISDPVAMKQFVKEQLIKHEDTLTGRGKSPAFAGEYVTKDGRKVTNRDFTDVDATADDIADNIVRSLPNLTESAVNAAKLAKVKSGELVSAVSEDTIKTINNALNLNKSGEAIETLLNSTDMFRKAAQKLGIKNTDEYVEAAQKNLADDLGLTPSQINKIEDGAKVSDEIFPDDVAGDVLDSLRLEDPKPVTKKVDKENAKTVANDVVRKETQDSIELAAKAGNSAGDIGDAILDISARETAGFMQGFGRAFNANYGMADSAATFHKGEQMIRATTGQFAEELTKVQKTYDKETITQMFGLMRKGDIDSVPEDLQKLFNMGFDGGKNGRLAQAGILPDDFAYFAQKNGIEPDFMPKYGAANPWEDVKIPVDKMGNQDVLAYMKNLFTAQVQTMQYSQMGKSFSAMFGSKLRQNKNWFKPSMNFSDRAKSQLTPFIDPNKYYPREILDGFSEMNRFIHQMDNLGHYGNATSLMNTVKKITGRWKLWQTVVRPGHHVKNQVGDMTLTFLAGYTNPDIYAHSARILKLHNKDYRGLNGLARRMDEDIFGIPPNLDGQGVGKVNKWGKHEFPDEEIHTAAMQENLLTTFYTAEDLSFSGIDQSIKAAKNPVTKTLKGVEHAGGTISEIRDKHVRLSHYVGAVRKFAKKNPSWSKSKVYGAAASEVRKWHPNGTGLSPWENKYAKVGIMFYSWQRQVLPLMLESLATRPGRVTVAPKAMYAIAEANGIDLDSFGNPFPADNIYPEFLTEGAYGPQATIGGQQLGVKPGIPQMDFLAEYGTPTQAGNSILSSVNPLVRAPAEFASGQRWGVDNIPISDKSEYVDNQIPLASYVNNATGRSLSSGFTQKTRKAEEDRNPPITRTLLNLLLGGGITDYTDPKFQEIGQKDLKERQK